MGGGSSSTAVLDPVPGHIRFQLELGVGLSGTCCHVPAHNIDAERSCIKASSVALARLDAQEPLGRVEIERALLPDEQAQQQQKNTQRQNERKALMNSAKWAVLHAVHRQNRCHTCNAVPETDIVSSGSGGYGGSEGGGGGAATLEEEYESTCMVHGGIGDGAAVAAGAEDAAAEGAAVERVNVLVDNCLAEFWTATQAEVLQLHADLLGMVSSNQGGDSARLAVLVTARDAATLLFLRRYFKRNCTLRY
jgi:hypothetical protein